MRILESDLFAKPIYDETVLVCPVNTVGVMGKGLALEFKRRYPRAEEAYKDLCAGDKIKPGKVIKLLIPEYPQILLFPSKRHWRDPSDPQDIVAGLLALQRHIKLYPEDHIRLPAVGCGLGGLSFEWLVEQCWTILSGYDVDLYTPWAGKKR